MDDLSAELGMSKKTFYAHFASKRALLEAVLQSKLDEVGKDLDQITRRKSPNFLTSLHQLLACLQRHMDEIHPSFVRDIRREQPDLFKLVETRRREYIQQHFGRLLRGGQRTGLIRKDIPVDFMIEILVGGVQAIVNPQKLEELGLAPRTALMSTIRVILEGALASKGRKKL
jgi:TetR/AcrR family transcriptional regulator, cholesterol catabolism regulator